MEDVDAVAENDGAGDAAADIRTLADLDERVVDEVVAQLSRVAPSAITEEVLQTELSDALLKAASNGFSVVVGSPKSQLKLASVAQRIAAVVWHVYHLSVTADDEVAAVVESFGAWLMSSGEIEARTWEIARPRLVKLATVPSVFVAVKATDLRNAAHSSVASVRVICDLRPIFATNVEKGPIGFTLLHTLVLSNSGENDESPIFVSMSDEVLLELDDQIRRALKKRDALKALVSDRVGAFFAG
jgi:hypothetical protein